MNKKQTEGIIAALFLLAVAFFLIVGFTRGIWNPTWVVFIIAAAIAALLRAFAKA